MVLVRKHAFERRFAEIVNAERLERRAHSQIGFGSAITRSRSLSRQHTIPEERIWVPGLLPTFRSPSWGAPVEPNSSFQNRSSEKNDPVAGSRPHQTDTRHLNQQLNQATPEVGDDARSVAPDEAPPNEDGLREHTSHTDDDVHISFAYNSRNDSENPQSNPEPGRMLSPYTNVLNRATTLGELEQSPSADGSVRDDFRLNLLHKLHRNSTFHNLTEAERQKLGGAEYRAVSLLAIIVPIYFFLWQLLGGLGVGAYLARNKASVTESNGLNPWFVSSQSLFCGCLKQLMPSPWFGVF